MELEEALKVIEDLKTEATAIAGKHNDELTTLKATHDKELQVNYNKGFDKAKNASKEDIEKGFISKDEVTKMLSDAKSSSDIEIALATAGVKDVKKAMKLIDDKENFDVKKFQEENDFMFKGEKKSDDEKSDETKPPKNIMKNNDQSKEDMNAETYSKMSDDARSKIPLGDKFALLD